MSLKLLRQIATRLGANVVTLLIVSVVTFFLMNIKKPEDIARSVLGREIYARADRAGLSKGTSSIDR